MRFRSLLTSWLALGGLLSTSAAFALTSQHRLGHEAVPVSESVSLVLDASRSDYSGSARIAIRVGATTDSFQLHALGLTLTRLALEDSRGEILTSYTSEPAHGILTVHCAQTLRSGTYTLSVDFTHAFDTRANGLYRLETGGNAYVFSQFEAQAAREAFPCWDEPEFKIPWQITVTVPREHLALSNMPIEKEVLTGTQRRVVFQRTPPLPSYLIAIATGPLEATPIPGLGVPGRVITVKG